MTEPAPPPPPARRLRPRYPDEPVRWDAPLEGLRGLCALLVVLAHLMIPGGILPGFAVPEWVGWFDLGSFAVLIFFVLSGYVIGRITTREFTPERARAYLGRRALRLVPINTAAVLFSWVCWPHTPLRVIFGNLLFLENGAPYPFGLQVLLLANNVNLWTLPYEALYYLLFLGIWRGRPTLGFTAAATLAVAGSAFLLPLSAQVFSRFAFGFLFWVAGLVIAWWCAPAENPRSRWPAALLGAYALWRLDPGTAAFTRLHFYAGLWQVPTDPHRLIFLPAAAWVLLAVTGRGIRAQRWLAAGCAVMSGATVAYKASTGQWAGADLAASVALVLSVALAAWSARTSFLRSFAGIGSISFAVYALGTPMIDAIRVNGHLPADPTWASYLLRVAFLAAVLFPTAWLLERRIQPAIRRRVLGPA